MIFGSKCDVVGTFESYFLIYFQIEMWQGKIGWKTANLLIVLQRTQILNISVLFASNEKKKVFIVYKSKRLFIIIMLHNFLFV